MVLSLAVKQLRRRGSRFGCPTNASLYSFVLGGAVKAGVGVGSALFFQRLPYKIEQITTAAAIPAKSADRAATSANLIRLICTAPKYTAST